MIFAEDGRILIHQSWLDTYTDCPERARYELLNGSTSGDAACCGTAMHAAIEAVLLGEIEPSSGSIRQRAEFESVLVFNEEQPEYKTFENFHEARAMAGECAVAWLRDIWPDLPKGGIPEVKFITPPIGQVHGHDVCFEGMADYVLPDQVWDWKSSGRTYDQKKKQKTAIQPSVYTYAASVGALGYPADGYPTVIPFRYGVMVRGKHPKGQKLTVLRHRGHWEWAIRRTLRAVEFALDYGLHREWQTNESSFLCGDKWCGNFSNCRGAHLTWRDDAASIA